MAIVMKLYRKSLADIIFDPSAAAIFTPETCIRFSFHIVLAMTEIHSLGVVHRDLKSMNLLLDAPEGLSTVHWKVVVCDFGLAKIVGDLDVKGTKAAEVDGISVRYAAPEVFKRIYKGKMRKNATATDATLIKSAATLIKSAATLECTAVPLDLLPTASIPEHRRVSEVSQESETSAEEEKKSDVYAFAIIVWEILHLALPWTGINNDEIGLILSLFYFF